MFEHLNNILCVEANWLISTGIVSDSNYAKMCDRGHFNRLQKGGNGRKALIEYATIRPEIKKRIIELVGDPTQKARQIKFIDFLKTDHEASTYFHNHTLDNGEALPEKNIREYIANAEVLNAITSVIQTTSNKRKAFGTKLNVWPKIAEIVQELPAHSWPHKLPANHRKLKEKHGKYVKEGYQSLIHRGFCSKNAEKLGDEAKAWVLARWADQVDRCANYAQLLREYNQIAVLNEWKLLQSDQTLQIYLQDPNVEPLWFKYRYGSLRAKERFDYQHSTKMPGMRDALWYSDGTKLNYYYKDDNGKMATCQVYEVFDTYSEVFLGYHISKAEDFEAQFYAFKMALQISGHKPFEVKFDNQGGTKKLIAAEFLGKLSRLTRNTKPYNGKSKTIEYAFGRFQQEFLKRDWFFTGQNITAKRLESKANMETILDNVKNLPSLSQIKEVYAKRRQEWNAAPHSQTGKPRLEMYLQSENPATTKVEMWDMIEMFWLTRPEPVTSTAYGITFKEKGQKYFYTAYNEDRMPDVEWLRRNIDRKFVIKYDPDDLSLIYLCEQTPLGLRRVREVETKTVIHRAAQEHEEWEATFRKHVEMETKRLALEDQDKMEQLLEQHGRRNEDYGLNKTRIRGIQTAKANKTKQPKDDIGTWQKAESNADMVDAVGSDLNIYNMM